MLGTFMHKSTADGTMKAGELLILTTGEYSDYSINLTCRVLKDFNINEIFKQAIATLPELLVKNGHFFDFNSDLFIHFLIEQQVIEEVEYREFNIECDVDYDFYGGSNHVDL